jgi:NDP-sugar pyrophosphorylase family protein
MSINKAMILAAGFGTRLKPMTDNIPKPLVKVNNQPMIKIVLDKLIKFGINEVIINTHYLSEQIVKYFEMNDFAVKVNLIYEPEILGTGGGILNAAPYFKNENDILIYNVDVSSDIDLNVMYEFHKNENSVATLAVQKRKTTRPLLIDEGKNLVGRQSGEKIYLYKENAENWVQVGFCGIHIISTKLFSLFNKQGFFDIFTTYFRLIEDGWLIKGFQSDNYSWFDMGKYSVSVKHSL